MKLNKQIVIIKKLISIMYNVNIKNISDTESDQYLLDETCTPLDLIKNFVILNDKKTNNNHELELDVKALQQTVEALQQTVEALQAEVETLKLLQFADQKPFNEQFESTKWLKDMESFLNEQKLYSTLDVVGYKLLTNNFSVLLPKFKNQVIKDSLKEAFQELQDICECFEIPTLKEED